MREGSRDKILLAYQCSYLFSLPSSKITFSDYSLVFKGEENKSLKKSLGVHRIGKEVSGHFYKEFEARNTQKKQSA